MKRAAFALINLSYLKHNLSIIKKIASNSKVSAVVKADAYGHGMVSICQALNNVDALSVACINEAVLLRENLILKPILALQGFNSIVELEIAITRNIDVVLHNTEQLEILKNNSSKKIKLNVFIKIDTGMNRLGFDTQQFDMIVSDLNLLLTKDSKIRVMTHLACADELDNDATQIQIEKFDQTLDGYSFSQSIANSAGILAWPKSHRDWVRPGLMLYGVNPIDTIAGNENLDLKPVMSLFAPIIAIKNCKQGDKIGYGGDYCCPHNMVIAVIAAGYADGYPRHISGTPNVWIKNKTINIVGRISMDMITVDITGLDVQIGDEVELWGENVPVANVARHAETISYELLCAAGNAVPKEYIN